MPQKYRPFSSGIFNGGLFDYFAFNGIVFVVVCIDVMGRSFAILGIATGLLLWNAAAGLPLPTR